MEVEVWNEQYMRSCVYGLIDSSFVFTLNRDSFIYNGDNFVYFMSVLVPFHLAVFLDVQVYYGLGSNVGF